MSSLANVAATDGRVVTLARTSREMALALLYETYRSRIYTFVLRLCGDADAADDLTQETFLKAYRGMRDLAADHRLLPWLYRIATNAAIDAARRRKRIRFIPLLGLVGRNEEPETGDGHHGVGERDDIRRALSELPLENAAALLLHALEGYSYKEIADIQKVSLTAVRSRIARARAAFRESYATMAAARSSSE